MTVPTVSVVIPAYNRARFVGQAIQSALHQEYVPAEVIVVDDCSTDPTIEAINEYSRHDPRVRAVRQPLNLGPAGTRNRGVKEARGEYVAFLDSDDAWTPNHLAECMAFFEARPELDVVFGDLRRMSADGKALDSGCFLWDRKPINCFFKADPLKSSWFRCDPPETRGFFRSFMGAIQTSVMRTSLALEFPFDESLRAGEDYGLFLDVACAGKRFGFVKSVHLDSCIHDGNLVSNGGGRTLIFSEHKKLWKRFLARSDVDPRDRRVVRRQLAKVFFDEGYTCWIKREGGKARRLYLASFATKPALRPLKAILVSLLSWPSAAGL